MEATHNATAPTPEHIEEGSPQSAILFIGVSLTLGIACRHVLKGTKVPYTIALLILGIGLGSLEYGTSYGLGILGYSIRNWSQIDPNLILFVFLPALLFESSFAMEVHQIKRCLPQMVLLAGPGVVVSTFSLGIMIHYFFPYGWNWSISLLLGALLSSTDPVAVVGLLQEIGASKKLRTIIEGESLINDGAAIVIFHLFLQMALGHHFSAGQIIEALARVSLGGVALGIGFGLVSVLWLGVTFNDTVIEITLTLITSYLSYYTAEDEAKVSGVLAVITVGIVFAVFARTAFKGESQQSMHYFWEMVAYIGNTLIFLLSGVVIAESILRGHSQIEGKDWAYLVLLYIFLQVSRGIVVIVLYPGLKYFGYGLNLKEAIVLVWSGLRGAVALALSLSVSRAGSHSVSANSNLFEKTQSQIVFYTGGVVFLTLIINGSTMQFLLQILGLQKPSEIKLRILNYTRHEMNDKALVAFEELGEDEDLGPTNWATVKKHIHCLNIIEEESRPAHPHEDHGVEIDFEKDHLQDTRIRLLNGVQAAYWHMLEEGRITQTAALLLMQSVDEALDSVVKHETLLDWKSLAPYVHFPQYLKYFQLINSRLLPKKLLNFLRVERLELGCYISAAFLRGHRYARCQLQEFIGESHITERVIQESEAQGEMAKQFLEDVRLTFPEVLMVVKTKQVTYAILNHLSEYVQDLEKSGLLEERETNQLHDSVQADLKKLLRNPPNVKMPLATEVLSNHPMIGALPKDVRQPLILAAKEYVKLRQTSIYTEDSKSDGIWLIVNGVVKSNNNNTFGRHIIHPTFSHGSTLRLYEVITGKNSLCDVTADSVVRCFFIEASKIITAMYSSSCVESFFWQESALAVAKILLPQYFNSLTMQELRALALNGSVMRIFLTGEIIEIHHGEAGILLEGFLKQDGKEDIITAPFPLLSTPGENQSGLQTEISSHPVKVFYAQARCRILVIQLSPVHSELRRSSTSRLIHRYSAQSMNEHSGLPRWPDVHFSSDVMRNSTRKPNSLQAQNHTFSTKLSAKALELNIFGSKVKKSQSMPRVFRKTVSMPRRISSHVETRFRSASMLLPGVEMGSAQSRFHRGLSIPAQPFVKPFHDDDDDLDEEEEQIVQIDSPTTLFRNPSTH